MPNPSVLSNPDAFSSALFEKMKGVNAGIEDLALIEFRYALHDLVPGEGWQSVDLEEPEDILQQVSGSEFFKSIRIKPRVEGKIVLDEQIIRLARMLFVGLVVGKYPPSWIREHFYFDLRGFYFLVRTTYFNPAVKAHLGGKPYRQFERKQETFEKYQGVGYPAFMRANAELDAFFIQSMQKLVTARGTPVVLAIAGQTAAGKTEIVERLRSTFEGAGQQTTSIEMDNFLTDRDHREAHGIDSLGQKAIHFELFKQSLEDILQGQKISIPRYDFIQATSSHNLDGKLKSGCSPIEIEPAEIIFIEGNFPFLIQDTAHLIGVKVVYLTDDPVRMKRKWKRDMDYRQKYDPNYFRNRYFREQFLMAMECYQPQMEICDIVVDTTGGALWATPETIKVLQSR
jgi:uridine kinase